MVKYMERYP